MTVTNNSQQPKDIVIFQKPEDPGGQQVFSLAWLTAKSFPGTRMRFTWRENYSFVWSQTSELRPGVLFDAQQIEAADPQDENNNHTLFERTGNSYSFVRDSTPGQPGSLVIRTGSSVQPDAAAIGIGMSDKPIFAVSAQPNLNVSFTPHPNYWIAAGDYQPGQVLDAGAVRGDARLPFGSGFSLNAVLGASGDWNISPGQ